MTLRFDAKPGDRYKINVVAPKDRKSAWKLANHFNGDIIDEATGKPVSHLCRITWTSVTKSRRLWFIRKLRSTQIPDEPHLKPITGPI